MHITLHRCVIHNFGAQIMLPAVAAEPSSPDYPFHCGQIISIYKEKKEVILGP